MCDPVVKVDRRGRGSRLKDDDRVVIRETAVARAMSPRFAENYGDVNQRDNTSATRSQTRHNGTVGRHGYPPSVEHGQAWNAHRRLHWMCVRIAHEVPAMHRIARPSTRKP